MQSQLITASNVAVPSDAEVMAKEAIGQFVATMQFNLRRFGPSMQDPRVGIDETERNLVRQYLAVWEMIEDDQNDESIERALMAEDGHLGNCEAAEVVAKAREIREAVEAAESQLAAAYEAYGAKDYAACLEALRRA